MKTPKKDPETKCRKLLARLADWLVRLTPQMTSVDQRLTQNLNRGTLNAPPTLPVAPRCRAAHTFSLSLLR